VYKISFVADPLLGSKKAHISDFNFFALIALHSLHKVCRVWYTSRGSYQEI